MQGSQNGTKLPVDIYQRRSIMVPIVLTLIPEAGEMRLVTAVAICLFVTGLANADDKARVFITDSQSWEMAGAGGGANGTWGSSVRGGARPQTAEIIKTFSQRCPQVVTNNIQAKTDYIVLLDHEGGKGLLRVKNKVAVFTRITGDSLVSKSTHSLGGSVQEACDAITRDWAVNRKKIQTAEAEAENAKPAAGSQPSAAAVPEVAKATSPKITLASNPDGADIEVDGNFMGNAPSTLELTPGEHTILIHKAGYKDWEKKLKVTGGEIRVNAELEKVTTQQGAESGK
jgi:hypothetical protein